MIRRYTDLRTWLRSLARSSIHAGTETLLAGVGSNSLETVVPSIKVGLSLQQLALLFISAAFWQAVRKINEDTKTQPPFASTNNE